MPLTKKRVDKLELSENLTIAPLQCFHAVKRPSSKDKKNVEGSNPSLNLMNVLKH